ncbi:Polyphosphate kinase 2, PPK2 family [Geodermatophilus saharensis]|uniref:Polyphosphate kinase 2, PPK2 family n=1 Tax=Geodermatophilus saharensis TaxID=1137994 RepID=A0A239GJN1_9ACTN|nr:polyphosphate kinase 2 [Geodermatophilus saharensis]SNS68703.1 Polyphosphate kinase 2, PPK2 family [Geodermatophilus saharensis]
MAAQRTPVASLAEAQPVELHLDGAWRAAALLGWRHDADGRCRVRVRVARAGVPRVVWAPLELLRLPGPAPAARPDVVVPVPRGSLPPPHRAAAPASRPRGTGSADAGRWTLGRAVPEGTRTPQRPGTWREDHPYPELLRRRDYEPQLCRLQLELLKLQRQVEEHRRRVAIVVEGRDAAGTSGFVRCATEHLDPRTVRVVAAPERPQGPARLSLAHLPAAGEIVLFDRSWFGRPAVEAGTGDALPAAAASEQLLVAGGLHLVKLWFAVSRGEQRTRLALRRDPPALTAGDLAVLDRWDDHTGAEQAVLGTTSTPSAPWTVVRANDRRRARLEGLRHLLSVLDHPGRHDDGVGPPDPLVVVPAAVPDAALAGA